MNSSNKYWDNKYRNNRYRNKFQKNFKHASTSQDKQDKYKFKNKDKEEEPINLLETLNFPSLSQNEIINTEKKDYKKLCNKITSDNSIYNIEDDNNKEQEWTILTGLLPPKNQEPPIEQTEYISPRKIYKCYNKMSNNWNKFRDEINNLYGDTSPYYDYKHQLVELINEDDNLYNELYNDDSYSSDDDSCENDNDEFYYK